MAGGDARAEYHQRLRDAKELGDLIENFEYVLKQMKAYRQGMLSPPSFVDDAVAQGARAVERWLTVREAAGIADVTDDTVRRWVKKHAIGKQRKGRHGKYRVDAEKLKKFLDPDPTSAGSAGSAG